MLQFGQILCGVVVLLMLEANTQMLCGRLSVRALQQLATATDQGPELDEGAWYPLLEAALQEPPLATERPDWAALEREPAAAREQAWLLEGRFAGRARSYALARSGPWGAAVTEWVLIMPPRYPSGPHSPEPEEQQVVVVYLVDPTGDRLPQVRPGQRVRVPARFYKIWSDRDLLDEPMDYLCFVAAAAWVVVETSDSAALGRRPGPQWVASAVAAAGVIWGLVVWSVHRGRRRPSARLSGSEPSVRPNEGGASPLPAEPEKALAELARRAGKERFQGGSSFLRGEDPSRGR